MSHMKEISIRELHRRTGVWVRSARKYGAILVRDRNMPVAKLVPVSGEPPENLFERWKPLKKFAAALDRPVRGRPVEDIIGEDRDR
jgi:antitoxin (DNA-binding transcriptional repressor) of toxin-antitoxin stability system